MKPIDSKPEAPPTDTIGNRSSGPSPQWGDGLGRLVIAAAIYGDLIQKLPGALTADLFGDVQSPREQFARLIVGYIEKYGTRPTASIVDELVRVECDALTEPEQKALMQEWQYVQAAADDLPDDPKYVEDELRKAIETRRLTRAITDAATALDKGGLDEAREILAKVEPVMAGVSGRLILTDAIDMLREPIKPREWHLRPLLPTKTLALLTSYTGEGKTTFLYPLLTAVSRGEKFLDLPTKQTNVMILAVEEDRDSVIRRLTKFAYGPALQRGQILVHAANLTASEQTYRDIRRVAEDNGVGLILVDTLAQFWTVKEENANAEVALAMREFLSIAHDDGRSVFLSHHDGKNESARKSRGASALPGIVDLHLSLARIKGADKADPRRVLSVEKKRAEETPWSSINLTFTGDVWTYATADTAPEMAPADQVVQAVQTYRFTVGANPEGMTPREIGRATGLEGTVLDRAIAEAGDRLVSNERRTTARRYTTRTNSQEVPFGVSGASGDNS